MLQWAASTATALSYAHSRETPRTQNEEIRLCSFHVCAHAFLPCLHSLCSFPPCLRACTRGRYTNLIRHAHRREREARSNPVERRREKRTRWRGTKWGCNPVLEGSDAGTQEWGGNLQWWRNQFRLQPTCHINFEF